MPTSTLNQWLNDYQQAQSGAAAGGAGATTQSQLGPFLGEAWSAIQSQEALPGKMQSVADQTLAEGQSMMQMATTGSGLFPSQQAYVTQAQQTGETQAASELAKLGLSNSTMAGQLQEQADLSAAATAGQLSSRQHPTCAW